MLGFYALVTLCLFGNALAQIPGLGGCPDVDIMPNFEAPKYLGTWFEARRYFAFFELGGKCVEARYSAGENGTIGVVNSQINSLTGNPKSIKGVARVANASEPAKLKVKFDSMPFEGDYWVVGTNYDNYTVVYSCTSLTFIHFKFAWILTREQNPPDSVVDTALAIAEKNHVNTRWFSTTNQKNCEQST